MEKHPHGNFYKQKIVKYKLFCYRSHVGKLLYSFILMEQLPPETVVHILSFLEAKDVASFCSVDKSARELAKEQYDDLCRHVECDGNIVAEKLGGLYVPNNEPPEKEREEMRAKFLLSPFGLVEGKLAFEGEYGSRCFWNVKKGMLHDEFECVMETAYGYSLVEKGSYRRGKKHGEFISYIDCKPEEKKTSVWKRGVLKRSHKVSREHAKVKEYRTFTERKSRKKYLVKKKEEYFCKGFIWYDCGGNFTNSWERHSGTKKKDEIFERYMACWCDGESWWRLENGSGVVSEKTVKSRVCLSGRCCETHGSQLESVISGDFEFDYDDIFCN
ncbi:hypothetical protein PMV_024 [Port-miou virus]|uniref:F-box domain-containing protein n=1 Tax=Port-miou virus TaxID=1733873 RepID=A0A0N9PV91_9VIRU|nr:hypothetical protein PMV_024 [Port-miou virus]